MTNLFQVDWTTIPAPIDDGAASHLLGLRWPAIALPATDGRMVDISVLQGMTVVYAYPMTGRPGLDIDGGERLGVLTGEGRNGAGPLDPPGRAVVVVDHLAGHQGDDPVPFLAGLQFGGARRHQPRRPLPLRNEFEQVEGYQQGQQSADGWNPAVGEVVVAGNERRARRDLDAPGAIRQVKVPVEMPVRRRLEIGRGGVIVQPALLAVGGQIHQAERQLSRLGRSERVTHRVADADRSQHEAAQPRPAFLDSRFDR